MRSKICQRTVLHLLRSQSGTELPTSALQRFRPESEGQQTFRERNREGRS